MTTDQSDVQSRSEVEPAEEVELIAPFSEGEKLMWTIAIGLVHEYRRAVDAGEFVRPPHEEGGSDALVPSKVRCHEVATTIGRMLKLPMQSGWVGLRLSGGGGIEHSWLWTEPLPAADEELEGWAGNILDPWVMGGYPVVQLVSCRFAFAQVGLRYQLSPVPRADVDLAQVDLLERFFREYMEKVSPKKKT